jgi:cytochrome c-type biogenesis protein CcmE
MTTPQPSTSAGVRRRRAQIAIACCVAAVVAIVALTLVLSGNVVYFRTVSEAVESRPDERGERLRVAGEVVPGTVRETEDGVRFEITDGKATVDVVHRGDPPELFGTEVPIVCEGVWSRQTFSSDRILIRHGNEYQPPEVDSDKAER